MKNILLITILFLSFFIPSHLFAYKEKIVVWNYYLAPPFFISQEQGLAYDFVSLLNEKFENEFIFKLQHIPRARLNKYLSSGDQGIVLFVNWLWMGKDSKDKYFWSDKILDDKNIIVSNINKQFMLENLDPSSSLVFGGIRGRKYRALDEYFRNNSLKRYDVNSEKQVLNMIVKNRVDITTQPFTIATSIANNMNIRDELFFSPKALFSFSRYIMISPKLEELKVPLNSFVKQINENSKWQEILKKYKLVE